MALSASTVLEVRQTGSDTNGGGYVSGGTDWSQQDAAQYSVTDAVTNGTTTITSAAAAFGTDVVGNLAYVQGGTGSVVAGWYQVISRTNATTIVVDRSTGLTAGTGVTLKIGGALATPGLAASLMTVSGMRTWVKYSATVYSLTTSTAGAGGPIAMGSGVACSIEGYDVTRGDRTGNRPTYRWTAASSVAWVATLSGNAYQSIANIILDANSVASVNGVRLTGTKTYIVDVVVLGAVTGYSMATGYCINSKASSCTTGFSYSADNGGLGLAECYATGCTTGFSCTGFGGSTTRCLARACTNGFSNTGTSGFFDRCTADGNTTAGFVHTGTAAAYIACLSSNQSGGSGVGFNVGTNVAALYNCAVYNNTTHVNGTPFANEGQITLTADPYQNQAGADFRPNTTAGGGAALRNTGVGVFGQTDNSDVGAVQHTDPAGGGNTYVVNQIRNMFLFNETEP
jgi:hypothetical protein